MELSARALRRRWKRACGAAGERRCWALALGVAAALIALVERAGPRVPARAHTRALLPAPAHTLAHLLADFSVHASLHPNIDSWAVEEESNNYTVWHYSVSYRCGQHCTGRALVVAHALSAEGAAPAHGAGGGADAHRVLVVHRACYGAPLLPWLRLCDEWSTETVVRAVHAGGAMLEELAERRCGAARALAARAPVLPRGAAWCAPAALHADRQEHLQRIRALVDAH